MATFLSNRILLPLLIETGSVTFVVLGISLPILNTTQPDSYQQFNSSGSDQGTSTNLVSTVDNPNSSVRPTSYVGRLQPQDFYSGESANVSRLLDSLLRGYDKRLRPNYNGAPVEVGITMFVSTVSSVSEVNMDFTLDFYFRQHWRDARLQFTDEEDELCISNEMLDRIWWPDTFFANAKMAHFHTATTHNAFLRIKPSGWITQSLRLTVTSMCSMDLTYFPMDTQVCNLEIESYAYSVKHIIYTWKDGQRDSVGIERTLQLPQFRVRGYRADPRLQVLSTGNYSRLFCEFYLARSLGYYVIHIYVPSCLIVVLSWISFWLHRDASPARVALGITTVLTMTTLISSSNASLPKISYLKSIDIYLVTCFVMVFASLLEYACVSYLSNRKWLPPPLPKRRNSDGPAVFEAGSDVVVKPPSRMLKLNNRRTGCSNGPVINKSNTGSSDGDVTPSTNLPTLPFPASHSSTDCNQHTPLSCRPTSLLTSGQAPTSQLTSGQAPTSQLTSGQACPTLSSRHCLSQRNFSALRCCSAFESEMKRPPPSVVGGADRVRCPPASVVGGNPYVILACNIDTYSRAMFPLAFFVFNLLYWIIFLHISSDRLGPDVVPI